jgi:hypothetical protein
MYTQNGKSIKAQRNNRSKKNQDLHKSPFMPEAMLLASLLVASHRLTMKRTSAKQAGALLM